MKRRSLLKTAMSASIISSIPNTISAKPSKAKSFRWRLSMVVPKTIPIWGDSVIEFARKVKIMTNGGLDIRVYGAGELVPALESFEAVKSGRIQMAHSAAYYWQGKIPSASFFCSVPFGMEANGMRAWLHSGGGQQLWDEVYSQHKLKSFPAGNTGMQMGGWFNKEINDVKDFKGLKIRIPGLGAKVVSKLGAKAILVPGGEIFTNLSTGVIDASEWVGPYHDYIMGFYKIAPYYYYPGWHEPGSMLELIINLEAWESLPEDYKQIVKSAARELDFEISSTWIAKDSEYAEIIKKENKVKFREFPKPLITKLKSISEEVKKEIANSDPLSKKVYTSYQNFQNLYENHLKQTLRSMYHLTE